MNKQFEQSPIRIIVVNSDPLRLVGFRALVEPERDFELVCISPSDLECHNHVGIILLCNLRGENLVDHVVKLKALHLKAQIIAVGYGMDDEAILAALACGAKGYVDDTASAVEIMSAIRAVSLGSVWVSRQLLSKFVERACSAVTRRCVGGSSAFTAREKQVLEMVVDGRSNSEIGAPLGITVRTVKAHVAGLMRKVGVRNRVALSAYVISHSLVSFGQA